MAESTAGRSTRTPYGDLKGEPMNNFDDFKNYVEKVMIDWKIPGLAVAVVGEDGIIFKQGFGLRNVRDNLAVTPDTLFAIGSCTKAFTAFAMGLLVEEGRLDWDAPVRKYIPEFRLKDQFATERLTAADLVSHRSGLPRHDLSWYIFRNNSRMELVEKLAHQALSRDLRTTFQYNNLMYVTAGVLIERITGMTWEDFVKERILTPLGMTNTNFSVSVSQDSPDHSRPYQRIKDEIREVPFYQNDILGPCGSIDSSINDMINWLRLHISKGEFNGRRIISESGLVQLHTPQIVAGTSRMFPELSHNLYGMGWAFNTYRGVPVMEHGGGIDGFISQVSFLPQQKIGLVVFTNLIHNTAPTILQFNIFDRILGLEPIDWNKRFLDLDAGRETAENDGRADSKSRCVTGTTPSHALQDYSGSYEHPGYGVFTVSLHDDGLRMETNSESFPLTHYHYDIFDCALERLDLTLKASFITDTSGHISSFIIPMEVSVPPVEFRRIADARMRDPEFLSQFTGVYRCVEIDKICLTVLLKEGNTLTMTISGQGDTVLKPYRGTEFHVGEEPSVSLEFVKDDEGEFNRLLFRKLDTLLHANRITTENGK